MSYTIRRAPCNHFDNIGRGGYGYMLGGLGKGLLFRLAAYALFVWGFWLLFQAFERSSVGLGFGGAAAILAAMWAMVGFRRPPSGKTRETKDKQRSDPYRSTDQ